MVTNAAEVDRSKPLRTPAVDIFEDARGIVLEFELPGIPREDIKVNLEEDALRVETTADLSATEGGSPLLREFDRANFAREFVLSGSLDRDKIEASWSNGVLVVNVAKAAEPRPRRILIVQG